MRLPLESFKSALATTGMPMHAYTHTIRVIYSTTYIGIFSFPPTPLLFFIVPSTEINVYQTIVFFSFRSSILTQFGGYYAKCWEFFIEPTTMQRKPPGFRRGTYANTYTQIYTPIRMLLNYYSNSNRYKCIFTYMMEIVEILLFLCSSVSKETQVLHAMWQPGKEK